MSLRKFNAVLTHVQETTILELAEHRPADLVGPKQGMPPLRRPPR